MDQPYDNTKKVSGRLGSKPTPDLILHIKVNARDLNVSVKPDGATGDFTFTLPHLLSIYDSIEIFQFAPKVPKPLTTGTVAVLAGPIPGTTCDSSERPCLNQPQEGDTSVTGYLSANPPNGAIVSIKINDKQLAGVAGQIEKDAFTFSGLHALSQYDTVEVVQTAPPPAANNTAPTTGRVNVKQASKSAQAVTQGNTCDKPQKPCLTQPEEGDVKVSGNLQPNRANGAVFGIKINDQQLAGVSGQLQNDAFSFSNLHPLNQYDTVEVLQTSPPPPSGTAAPSTGRVTVKASSSNKSAAGNTCDKPQRPCLTQPQEGDTTVSGNLEANPPSGAVVSIKLNDALVAGASGEIKSGAFTFTNIHPLSQYDTVEVVQTSPPPATGKTQLPTTGKVSVKASASKLTIAATSASLDFGHQVVETASAPKTVTLTNSSADDIDIEDPATTVTSPNYTISSDACVGTISKKANCTFNVAFAPFSSGPAPGKVEKDFVVIVPKNEQSRSKFRELFKKLEDARKTKISAKQVLDFDLQTESTTKRRRRLQGLDGGDTVTSAAQNYDQAERGTIEALQAIEDTFQVISLSGIPDHWTYPLTRAVVGVQLAAPSAQAVKQAYLVDFDLLAPLKILPWLPKNEDPIENRLWVWFNPQITSLPQAANFSALSTIDQTATFINGETSKGTLGDIQGLSWNGGFEFAIVKPRDAIPWWSEYPNTQARLSPSFIVGGGYSTPFSIDNTDVVSQVNQSICDAFSANVPPKAAPPTVSSSSGLVCAPGTAPSTSPVIAVSGGTRNYIDFFTPERSRFFSQFFFGLRFKTYFFSRTIKADCVPPTGRGSNRGDCDGLYNIFPGIVDLSFGKNEAVTGGHLSTWLFRVSANYPLPFYQGVHLFATTYAALSSNSLSQPFNPYTINTPTTGANNDANTFRYGLRPLNRDYYSLGVGVDLVQVFKKAASGGQPNSKAPAPTSNPTPTTSN